MINYEDFVEVYITNQGKYFRELGYGDCKQGTILNVKIGDLKPNSNILVPFSCDVCGKEERRQFQLLNKSMNKNGNHCCNSCSYDLRAEKTSRALIGKERPNQRGKNHHRYREQTTHERQYKKIVQKMTELVYNRFKEKINPHGFERGLCGQEGKYQLDHIVSVKEAYDKKLDIKYVVSPQNLRMLSWESNLEKLDRSDMDINQLIELVDSVGFELPELEMYGTFEHLVIETEEEKRERLRKVLSEAGKKSSARNRELKIGIFGRSKEQCSEHARIGALAAREKGVGVTSLSKEQLSENGKKGRIGRRFKYYNDGVNTYQYFESNDIPCEQFLQENPQFKDGRISPFK